MSGRHTGVGEYPEHLNPFREDSDPDDFKKNGFATLGRRKLRAVLNLTSWSLFPWRKPKTPEHNNSGRNRFLTMTPKLSRHLLERLSKRKPRSASLSPGSNPATSTGQRFSYADFRIMPKSSREKFAVLERERPKPTEEASYLWADRSSVPDLTLSSTSTSPISEVCGDDDLHGTDTRYMKQGARPKKKRPAPPPPSSMSKDPADDKHVNTIAETGESLTSPISKDNHVSIQDTPPASPTSKIIRVSVHQTVPDALLTTNISVSDQETSSTTNISVSDQETSPTSNISASVHETSPEMSEATNITVSDHDTSPTSNISVSVHEKPPETSPTTKNSVSDQETSPTTNISVPGRETSSEMSPISNISVLGQETSPITNISGLDQETSSISNISASAQETSPEALLTTNMSVLGQERSPISNINVTGHETSLETSPTTNISVSDHKKSPSSNHISVLVHETPPEADNQRKVTPTT